MSQEYSLSARAIRTSVSQKRTILAVGRLLIVLLLFTAVLGLNTERVQAQGCEAAGVCHDYCEDPPLNEYAHTWLCCWDGSQWNCEWYEEGCCLITL